MANQSRNTLFLDEYYICTISDEESENLKGVNLIWPHHKTKTPKFFECKIGSDIECKPLDFVNTGGYIVWKSKTDVFSVNILQQIKKLEQTRENSLVVEDRLILKIETTKFFKEMEI